MLLTSSAATGQTATLTSPNIIISPGQTVFIEVSGSINGDPSASVKY